MSFCVRTVPNKFASFVNTRKQVTKIDRQFQKNVKSTFLDEFICLPNVTDSKFNLKEQNLEVPVVHLSQQKLLFHYTNPSEWSESLGNKYENYKNKLNVQQCSLSNSERYMNTESNRVLNSLPRSYYLYYTKVQGRQLQLKNNDVTMHQNINAFVDNKVLLFGKTVCDSLKRDSSVLTTGTVNPNEESRSSEEVGGKPTEEQLQQVFQQLSHDLPKFFVQPMNYSIYDPNIIFINNIKGVTTQGFVNYFKQLALLKTIGHLKFAYVSMEVLKITMHTEDDTIKVRWRINGISATKMLFRFWKVNFFNIKESLTDKDVWMDGFSIFYVNSKGKIYKHIVDKMMPDEEKLYGNEKTPIITKLAMFISLANLETFQCSGYSRKLELILT